MAAIMFAATVSLQAQELNSRTVDPKTGQEILIGTCDREGLLTGKFGEMYRQYYPIYEPKKDVISSLKRHREGVDIVIVLGTWCSDSYEQVPKFFKVLDKMKFDQKKVSILCVDREKKAGELEVAKYNIVYVPTFILYRHGKEIGRIVETPVRTLEKDMMAILQE